ncbi:uncharacterized protein AMSG_02969 [Thecamonas trahens ATCC 50062]|uniref:Uncharacterized protein n=1 Tax=Thecamonas trahens ATCC 50062 TaxID=461836 RepID=A0A0L0D5D9_THETB|nr:hypothetical protein AMSG_02969 [Thecamonas trahens ATCC 50062]KNC46533.1 hypothetical protein AMSG_02969 [Thecamonas trahens ATCC 50062]|eukprot:XP_013760314.1 hypothetical protein AMSG_02969 [Thecamonas trahens ATCC 50062]
MIAKLEQMQVPGVEIPPRENEHHFRELTEAYAKAMAGDRAPSNSGGASWRKRAPMPPVDGLPDELMAGLGSGAAGPSAGSLDIDDESWTSGTVQRLIFGVVFAVFLYRMLAMILNSPALARDDPAYEATLGRHPTGGLGP